MPTMSHEQSGLPEVSYTETSFGGDTQSRDAKAWSSAKELFPDMSASDLEVFYNPKKKLQVKMKGFGKKAYNLMTEKGKKGSGNLQINPEHTKEIKNALGESIYEKRGISEQQRAEIQKQKKKEKEKELKNAESMAQEKDKIKKEMEELRNKMSEIDQQITDLENEHGPLDKEAIQKLKQEKRDLENEHQEKRKELEQARKKAQQAPKIKTDIQKLTEENAKLNETVRELQEKIDTETLNELKEQKAELERQNAEDRAVINDENTQPSEKTSAEECVEQRKKEIGQLTKKIKGMERNKLLEKIKDIFKKHGVTLTAIVLAAGVTISSVIGAIKNALIKTGKTVGNGLKEIGKK